MVPVDGCAVTVVAAAPAAPPVGSFPAAAPVESDLTVAYDDPEEPTMVTIYPEETDARSTTWISADVEHAVAVREVR